MKTLLNPATMVELMSNPAHFALWGKAKEGFRLISGQEWETRAHYPHFWVLTKEAHRLATGDEDIPTAYLPSLAWMLGAHAGRLRKGIRRRPYFHHILMVVYLAWLLRMPVAYVLAAIHHDDAEDLPEHLGMTSAEILGHIERLGGVGVLKICQDLTNTHTVSSEKHATQCAKMAINPLETGMLKLIDRICNLADMRYDRPKDFDTPRLIKECRQAIELANAMPVTAPDYLLAMLAFSINRLAKENHFLLGACDADA
jgi:(p)ppGpp synthase/HD superfamily hydrolase